MLKEHLEGLTDDRQPWKVKHNLLEIVVMTICAVIAGCDVWNEKTPLHMVSAWANAQRLVLGQVATAEKSNGITAVPNLLETLNIAGCIVTADAMSCQKEIAKTIVKKDGAFQSGEKWTNIRRLSVLYNYK